MLAGKVHDLHDLGFRDLIGVGTAFTHTVIMDLQHDPRRGFPVFLEKPLQDMNDEFHGSVIVIEKQHAIKAGLFQFWLGPGNNGRAPAGAVTITLVLILHFG